MPSKKQKAAQEKRARTLALRRARSWIERPSLALPSPRHGHAVCVIGTKLYVVGGEGYDPGSSKDGKGKSAKSTKLNKLNSVLALDTAADPTNDEEGGSWVEVSSGRGFGNRTSFAAAAVGGKIYAVGGSGRDGYRMDTVAVFDPSRPKGGWTVLPRRMNAARSDHAVCAVGSKLYAVGGCRQSDGQGRPEVFDTADPDGGWTYLPGGDLKTKERLGLSLAAVGTKIYALGGYVRGDAWDPSPSVFCPKNTVEVYDTARPDGGWRDFPYMHSGRKHGGVAVLGTRLYHRPRDELAIKAMDFRTKSPIAPMPLVRDFVGGAYWSVEYRGGVRIRVMPRYGVASVSGLFFD